MPVIQALVDFNALFSQLRNPPVIINDLPNTTEEDRQRIIDLTRTSYTSDMISVLPSCECTQLKGEFNLGNICPNCGTGVKSSIEDAIEPLVWLRAPGNVSPLISPIMLNMLSTRFAKSAFDVIAWIVDTRYAPKVRYPEAHLRWLERCGVQRGYNFFVDNFDEYMEILFAKRVVTKKSTSPAEVDYLYELIQRDRRKIFSPYLPLLHKMLLIIEQNRMGTYVDKGHYEALDAIQMLTSIDKDLYDKSPTVRENRTAKALLAMSQFFYDYTKDTIAPKPGHFRKHVMGSRSNFSFRAVITSITDPHEYDEIHIPWSIGLTAFRPHLVNKLKRFGYSNNAAVALIHGSVAKYNPLLDQLLKELIAESPVIDDKTGIVCALNRNPSLLQSSIQRVRITKVKTDANDTTIGISILIVVGFGADFDGDALNCSLAIDEWMANRWYPLHPMFNIYRLNKPFEVGNNITIPKPVIASIANWMSTPDTGSVMEVK